MAPTKPCKYFALPGGCARGASCRYTHIVDSPLPASPAPKDKRFMIPCEYFLRGACNKGDTCPYAHPTQPLLPPAKEAQPSGGGSNERPRPNHFTRELSGAIVHFEDGGRVSKVSLSSDFSAIRIAGLPLDSSPESVAVTLDELGFKVPATCVRIVGDSSTSSVSADVRVGDPTFAASFCGKLGSIWSTVTRHSKLQASPIATSILSESTVHQIDCKKVVCSWHKSSRMAWLNFGSGNIARRVWSQYHRGSYKILGKQVACDSPHCSPTRNNNPVAWTVVLKDLPGNTTREAILHSIKYDTDKPRHIELGSPSYGATDDEANAAVKSLLSQIGTLDSWEASGGLSAKRMKAKARFRDEADAREATRRLNEKPLPFSAGKLSVTLLTTAKFKNTTNIYDAVKPMIDAETRNWPQHLQPKVFRNTDPAQVYTVLKIEGEAKDIAKANDSLARILAGVTAMNGEVPIWSASFNSRGQIRKLEQIQQGLGVCIVPDKKKSQIRLYGAPEKCKEAQQVLSSIAEADSSTFRAIELDLYKFWWASHGGFQRIVSALGADVVAIDTVSIPKRILITGSKEDYHTALAIVYGEKPEERKLGAGNAATTECAVCWTEAEKPIRTQCGHLYCLECFENLCSSTPSGDKEFGITCQGNLGKCGVVLGLPELQDHLSSIAFEAVLETSFASYISRHPDTFRYCPTPDCSRVYRLGTAAKIYTCPQCLATTCMSCHNAHDGLTCAEYNYRASGEHEAFEKLKKEQGFQDCPKCNTTMEKTEGCDHMKCGGCGIHLCWVCLETFATAGPCYDHMNKKHNGIGVHIPREIV